MVGNKRNYERISKILEGGKIMTTREIYNAFMNYRSRTKLGRTKDSTHKPSFVSVQNLLSSCSFVERTNPNTNELAKWKLRDTYEKNTS